jgi:hypothetical protein
MAPVFHCLDSSQHYVYLGDRYTSDVLRGGLCRAVVREDGKCVRGRNGTMLVQFFPFRQGELVTVLGRRLRKLGASRNGRKGSDG